MWPKSRKDRLVETLLEQNRLLRILVERGSLAGALSTPSPPASGSLKKRTERDVTIVSRDLALKNQLHQAMAPLPDHLKAPRLVPIDSELVPSSSDLAITGGFSAMMDGLPPTEAGSPTSTPLPGTVTDGLPK